MATHPILIPQNRIQKRIKQLAREIRNYYHNKDLVILGLLNGSLFFLVDLLRHLPDRLEIECWRLRSYPAGHRQSTGKIEGLKEGFGNFKGKHVLIVDDILDTGLTLSSVKKRLLELGAREVKICVLLKKKKKRQRPITAKWAGFDIGDEFVFGYGLDYDGYYRQLPDIRILN
jgi:hypoxanthine phosphoribosyltransferase